MFNKDRIAAMTKMKIHEEGNGGKDIRVCEYYRSDYISFHVIKALIIITLLYMVGLVGMAILKIDYVLAIIIREELATLLILSMLILIGLIMVLSLVFYFIYRNEFLKAQVNTKKYYQELHKVNRAYIEERRNGANL